MDLEPLEKALEHRFLHPELLVRALTHSSASQQSRGSTYERMEFLGDRVLGLVVARMLYDRFPNESEGDLSKRHSALVRREALARVAKTLHVAPYVILSPGEEAAGGRENTALLADVCEALIAAVYLDGGIDPASAFIHSYWEAFVEENATPPRDSKTTLQEWAQGRGLPLPLYGEKERTGPDHSPVFTIEVEVQGIPSVAASGSSKRSAEQAAARELLHEIKKREER